MMQQYSSSNPYLVLTCCDESPVQGCGAQARASVMHGRQRLFLQLLRLGLKAKTLHQAGGGRGGRLRAATAVQEDHTQHTVQHSQTQVGVV